MILKTIERKLLSKPEIDVKIPEETIDHFADLTIIMDSAISLTDFKEKVEKHPYFSGIEGVPYVDFVYTAGRLKKTKSITAKSKYIDDLYLQIAQNDLKNIIEETEDKNVKKEAKDMNTAIDSIYKKIYKKEGRK